MRQESGVLVWGRRGGRGTAWGGAANPVLLLVAPGCCLQFSKAVSPSVGEQ